VARVRTAGALGFAAVMAAAVSAADMPSLERGRALYENHCVVCHTPKVHSRPDRIPLTLDELRKIVNDFAKSESLHWSEEDTEDVVWFLNQTKYRF